MIRNRSDLTVGNVYGRLALFTLPILLGNILQQFYSIADIAIVGRLLGEKSLAAVGASLEINNIILAIGMGMTLGIGIIISKMFGSGEKEGIQQAVDTGLFLALVISVIVTVFGVMYTDQLLGLFKVPQEIINEASSYLRIMFIGVIANFIYNAIINFLRGLGNSVAPLTFLVVSSILNISLTILFVGSFSMGVRGAAAATVISQFFVLFLCIIYVNRKAGDFRVMPKLNINFAILKSGLKISIPATAQQLFISLGSAVLQILINGFGTLYISAFAAASRIDGFATMPAINIGKAMSNFVAQNEGAKKYDRVNAGIRGAIIIMSAISVLLSAVIFYLARNLVALFVDSGSVINEGARYLCTVSVFYVVFSLMQIYNGVLLGKGKSMVSMIATIISFCAVQVPIAYFLSNEIGIMGIWIAAPVGWIAGLLIRYGYCRKLKKVYTVRADSCTENGEEHD